MKRTNLKYQKPNFRFRWMLILGMAFSKMVFSESQPENHLYFKDAYHTRFTSVDQAEKAKNENDFDVMLEYANYYYTTAADLWAKKNKLSIPYSEKALEVYQALWKKRFSDPHVQLLMANALLFQGTNPNINLSTLVEYVFRGRNLYSMIIDRYPENLEARLGRARINMGLNASTGRPDAIHREDIRTYLEGYPKLPKDMQENPYFKPGLHEMYLAKALLAVETKQWKEAEEYLNRVDSSILFENALKMYKEAAKELKKELKKGSGK